MTPHKLAGLTKAEWMLLTNRCEDDPAADYEVLAHVRGHWTEDAQEEFHDALFDLMNDAAVGKWLYHEFAYEPGFYSRAGMEVVGKGGK